MKRIAVFGILTAMSAVGTTVFAVGALSTSHELPSLGPVSQVTSRADIARPLDTYYSTDDGYTVAKARRNLMTDCMAQFGLKFDMPDFTEAQYKAQFEDRAFMTPEEARERGFYPGGSDIKKPANDSGFYSVEQRSVRLGIKAREDGTSPLPGESIGEPLTSFKGKPVPEGGCHGEVERKLNQGVSASEADLQLPAELAALATQRMVNDPRLKPITEDWSACLASRGHDARDVENLMADPSYYASAPAGSEIALAIANAECIQQTNAYGRRLAVEAAHQQVLIDENKEDLRRVGQAWEQRVSNARAALA